MSEQSGLENLAALIEGGPSMQGSYIPDVTNRTKSNTFLIEIN